MWLLVVPVVLVVLALAIALVVQSRRIRALEHELAAALGVDGPSQVEIIAVEIRNHVDVAAERSSLARPLGRLAPGMLRSIVHREALRMMRDQLAEQGVDADVRLRRLP